MESIYKFVAKQRDEYLSNTNTITEGYDFSQYETLRTIELYDNDRFLTGSKDSLDRKSRGRKIEWALVSITGACPSTACSACAEFYPTEHDRTACALKA